MNIKYTILTLLLFITISLKAQDPIYNDTVIVNGQKSQVTDLDFKKKTTFSFEDSTLIYQISILKVSKSDVVIKPTNIEKKEVKSPNKEKRKKTTRWLGEISFGMVNYIGKSYKPISIGSTLLQDDTYFTQSICHSFGS